MYLLDTNVISELRKAIKGKADQNVVDWANSVAASSLFISVISILELETGILLMERRDLDQGTILRNWYKTQVLPTFSDRTLDITTQIAQGCAKLHVPDPCSDRDALIAATALVHGMTVVTRNTSDFAATKVRLLNPWNG